MKKNVGTLDQQVRILLGSVLVLMGLFLPMNPTLQVVLFVVAGIAFVTGFVRLCPLWKVLGVSTTDKKKAE